MCVCVVRDTPVDINKWKEMSLGADLEASPARKLGEESREGAGSASYCVVPGSTAWLSTARFVSAPPGPAGTGQQALQGTPCPGMGACRSHLIFMAAHRHTSPPPLLSLSLRSTGR